MQRRLASSSTEPAGSLLQGLQAEASKERLTLAAPPLLLPRQQLQQRQASRPRAFTAPPALAAPGMGMGAAGPAAAGSTDELPLEAPDDSSSLLEDLAGNGTTSTRLGKITGVNKGKNSTAGSGGGVANDDYVPIEQRVILGALAGTVGDYFANIYIGQADIAIADPTIAAAAAAVRVAWLHEGTGCRLMLLGAACRCLLTWGTVHHQGQTDCCSLVAQLTSAMSATSATST
jgi:hypothetical protein